MCFSPLNLPAVQVSQGLHGGHISDKATLIVLLLFLPPLSPFSFLFIWHWVFGNCRTLFGNKIKSVAKKAFSGLEALEHL